MIVGWMHHGDGGKSHACATCEIAWHDADVCPHCGGPPTEGFHLGTLVRPPQPNWTLPPHRDRDER